MVAWSLWYSQGNLGAPFCSLGALGCAFGGVKGKGGASRLKEHPFVSTSLVRATMVGWDRDKGPYLCLSILTL